jgi:isopentenyl-diphosphate delta-isomerase
MSKSTVYSCYVFSPSGRVLLTRRSLGARPWPGVWMGSWWGACEPGQDPGQALDAAVRIGLGVTLTGMRLLVPEFRYDVGVSGDETVGPVFTAVTADRPDPSPRVVMDWRWVGWRRLVDLARVASWTMCPWVADQIPELDRRLAEAHPVAS